MQFGKGLQATDKGLTLFRHLEIIMDANCRTAAYACTAGVGEGNLNYCGEKTTSVSVTCTCDQWESRKEDNLTTAASLASGHPSQDGCNSLGGGCNLKNKNCRSDPIITNSLKRSHVN